MIHLDALPTIRGGGTLLRQLTGDDVAALFAVFSDPDVMRYWSHPPLVHVSEAAAYLEDIRIGFERRSLFQWGLCREGDDRVIGTCTLWRIDAQNLRAEVGFALAQAHWGRGWMTDGMTALIDYAFSELGLRRLEADVDPDNWASRALLERLGFEWEGYLRDRWLVAGETFDSIFYGLLERDWRRRGPGGGDSAAG